MRIVAGIDGGGTHTRVLLAREDGGVLGFGEAGPSNIHHVGEDGARENIKLAVHAAWASAGLNTQPCAAAFLGLAGISSELEREIGRRIACAINIAPKELIEVDHDIRIALAGGLAGREGIALIVGTGSSCYGRRDDGRECKVGGWGYLLDDVGGGVFLGLEALRAYVRVCDGRDKPGELSKRVKNALGLDDPRDLVRRMYRSEGKSDSLTPSEIAKLAPAVVKSAELGDASAKTIIACGAIGLAEMTEAAARKIDFGAPVRVVPCGSLATSSEFYRSALTEAIQQRLPDAKVTPPLFPPAIGAVILALKQIGVGANKDIVLKLMKSALFT